MEDTHFIDKEPNRYEALAELQKEQIQSMNEDQIIEIVRKFEIFWDLQTEDYRNARELGYRQFIHADNWDSNNNPIPGRIDILAIKGIRERQRRFIIDLKNRVMDLKIESHDVNGDGITLWKRVNNVVKQLKDGYENIRRHFIAYERVVNPMAVPQVSSSSDPSTMDEDEIEDCSPYQKCLLYTLDRSV